MTEVSAQIGEYRIGYSTNTVKNISLSCGQQLKKHTQNKFDGVKT